MPFDRFEFVEVSTYPPEFPSFVWISFYIPSCSACFRVEVGESWERNEERRRVSEAEKRRSRCWNRDFSVSFLWKERVEIAINACLKTFSIFLPRDMPCPRSPSAVRGRPRVRSSFELNLTFNCIFLPFTSQETDGMAPSPYSHLAQEPSDTSELLEAEDSPTHQEGGSTSLRFPLPPHPPILFGSNTSLPSSSGSYKDEDEKEEVDRFVQEGAMESGGSNGTRGWRAVEAGGGRRSNKVSLRARSLLSLAPSLKPT